MHLQKWQITKAVLTSVILLATDIVATAQVLPPDSNVPLDPFSWVLLGAGAAVAGKKYYDSKMKK